MAQLPEIFDSSKVEPKQSFSPLPAGDYLVAAEASDIKETAAKTGKMLTFTFTVLEGQYKGRKVFERLNIINPNPQAVEIAQSQLSALCRAAGVVKLLDSAQLHGIPVVAVVKYVPPKNGFDEKNEIKTYKAASVSSHPDSVPARAEPITSQTAAAKSGNKPKWSN